MMESCVLGPKTGPERQAGYQINIPPTPFEGHLCPLVNMSRDPINGITMGQSVVTFEVKILEKTHCFLGSESRRTQQTSRNCSNSL